MPFFEVTLSDGTSSVMQAHNKTQLRAALAGVTLTRIVPRRRCKQCHKAVSTVQNTLCHPCWVEARELCAKAWEDIPMTEQEFENLVISFFVEG